MKPSSVVVSVLFGVAALVAIVWIGRYPPVEPGAGSAPRGEVGPAISPNGPYPKAVVDETMFDFGTKGVGYKGQHTFTIRNEGQADLVLMARPEDRTCQCTAAALSKDTPVPAGQSVDVTVNWEVKALVSEFRHSATIRTNDPEHKAITLEVTGKSEETLIVAPATLWELGELHTKEPTVMTGHVHSKLLDDFKITSVDCGNPLVSITWEPLSVDAKVDLETKTGYVLKATVSPDVPIGQFSETVSIHTDVDDHPEIAFKLRGTRPGPIEFFGPGYRAEANALMLGEFPAKVGKQATLSVFVRNFDGDLKLTDVKQLYNSVQVELSRDDKFTGETKRYLLKITIPPGELQDHQGLNAEKVDLFFNHPEAEQVRLRVAFLAAA